ncbi:15949_t:CDS:2 [Cetraspora pellucida]|uniref:15949_t:CDS:1 n=1 Tax=Cetraspora pellucida TaxID=1433469 RepID=A0A9N9F7N8_9GLOM|nr:15949_t:CDS:2 [Cetraspora pellucida]
MSSMPSTKEFLFINECGKKQQSKTSPPKDLEIEFPPTFDFNELGDKFKNGKGKKKPPNAFILFRTKYNEALHRRGQFSPMKVVSGWARDAWNLLPLFQKQEYERFATRAASLYQEWALHSPSSHSQNDRIRNKRIRTASAGIFQPVLIPVESVLYDLNADIYNNFQFYNIGDFGFFNSVNYDPDLVYDVNDYTDGLSESD